MKKLSENPYLHYGEMSDNIYDLPGSISPAALKRDYSQLFSIEIEPLSMVVDILLDKWNSSIIGIQNGWQNSNIRIKPLYGLRITDNLEFKNIPEEIKGKKCITFDRHRIATDMRNNAIASTVYRKLIDSGYAIISDRTHFEPAKGLWIKLAKKSNNQHRVILVDVDYGAIKDEDGNTLYYNGSNYPNEQLWTSGSDYSGQYIVLVYYNELR
jgi:hypothetical protein